MDLNQLIETLDAAIDANEKLTLPAMSLPAREELAANLIEAGRSDLVSVMRRSIALAPGPVLSRRLADMPGAPGRANTSTSSK